MFTNADAYIVTLHSNMRLRTRIEPLVALDFRDNLEFAVVVEMTLSVSKEIFQGASYLGKISADQVSRILEAKKEFRRILSDSSMLMFLEVHNKDRITEELKEKAARVELFLPIGGGIKKLEHLHRRLQSVVQIHHEKFFKKLFFD